MKKTERPNGYPTHAPHFCSMDHAPIRHWDSEHEACPLCRALAHVEHLREELKGIRDLCRQTNADAGIVGRLEHAVTRVFP